MSVNKDLSGRRSVQVEVEVPGTPEEVWQAIATGPGISSWFIPSEVEERADGTAVSHFGPGTSMDSVATITVWDPPHRFANESQDLGPNAPAVATEWIVESRSGGTCVVRVVHSLFASADDWDNQLEGWKSGWPAFFRLLRLYLTHFRGQSCSANATGGRCIRSQMEKASSRPPADPALGGEVSGVPPGRRAQEWSGDKFSINYDSDSFGTCVLRTPEPAPYLCLAFPVPIVSN